MQFHDRSIERLAPWIDYDGPLWAQPIQMQADGLADAPLDAVADHGFAEGAGCGKADMRPIGPRLADAERREERTREPGALIVNSSEVFRPQQTNTFRKSRDGALPFGADSEFLAAAGAAAREYSPAILGFHARPEPVRLGAVAIVRLKGTFRHLSLTSFSIEQGGGARQTGQADRPGGLSHIARVSELPGVWLASDGGRLFHHRQKQAQHH